MTNDVKFNTTYVDALGNPRDVISMPREGDAGYDLRYFGPPKDIPPHSIVKFPLGLRTEFNSRYVGIIKDRSSVAALGVTVVGGVIDPTYRGEWIVLLHNTTKEICIIESGTKIAQVVFIRYGVGTLEGVNHLTPSGRGDGGFGSTGNY